MRVALCDANARLVFVTETPVFLVQDNRGTGDYRAFGKLPVTVSSLIYWLLGKTVKACGPAVENVRWVSGNRI